MVPSRAAEQGAAALSHRHCSGLEDAPEVVLGLVELEYPEKRRKGMFSTCGQGDPLGLALS